MSYEYDLHVHTMASDGGHAPGGIVAMARELGLRGLAITDHDSIASVAEANGAGRKAGIWVIPGVELTTTEGRHLLGYFISTEDNPLTRYLERLRQCSWGFMHGKLAELQQSLGLPVSEAELAERSGRGIPNMSHLLDLLYRKGLLEDVSFDSPSALALFKDPDYLVSYFREFARTRPFVDTQEAIGLIRAAGGAPVWAHPYRAERAEVERLKAAGLAGLEVDTPKHDPSTRDHLRALCRELDLVPTGGTDFHGRYFQSLEQGRQLGTGGAMEEAVLRLEQSAAAGA